jgi:hypothetical protein
MRKSEPTSRIHSPVLMVDQSPYQTTIVPTTFIKLLTRLFEPAQGSPIPRFGAMSLAVENAAAITNRMARELLPHIGFRYHSWWS